MVQEAIKHGLRADEGRNHQLGLPMCQILWCSWRLPEERWQSPARVAQHGHCTQPPPPWSKWPKARYRRQMKRRFHRRKYGQRWQCESVHSRIKRRLGSSLSGRSHASRKREALVKVLTHNLSILRPHRISTEQSHLINVDFCTCTFVLDV